MAQDIRKLVSEHQPETKPLSEGHEQRFETMLEQEFNNEQRPGWNWLKIAAIAIAFIAVGLFGYYAIGDKNSSQMADSTEEVESPIDEPVITLGDISPDLKKVEEFYLKGIDVQLASLEENPENKELIDGYKERLKELDEEYARLNLELNKIGPTEATINALIDNLKLRLELLFKLKNKLKELKTQENEQFENMQA